MSSEDISVLIVEDNKTQGKALFETLLRADMKPTLVHHPNEALEKIKFSEFQVIIIDLLLPTMNGIDLAEKINAQCAGEAVFVFMSGVFKDKQLVRKALQKVPSLGFFKKPANLQKIVNLIKDNLKPYQSYNTSLLYELFSKPPPSNKELVNILNDTKITHGFDLPWIYSLILNSTLSGTLNVMMGQGEIFTVVFHKGNMTHINLKDEHSYFGSLLIEMGFSGREEIDQILKNNSHKRLGERLVDINAISPHVIGLIKKQQMAIRLSKSTTNTSIEINFTDEDTPPEEFYLTKEQFIPYLNDIISSKIPPAWLKTFFTPFFEKSFSKGVHFSEFLNLEHQSVLKKFSKIIKVVDSSAALQKLMDANSKYEKELHRALYFLLNLRVFQFSKEKVDNTKDRNKFKRYKTIYKQMLVQNYFEILGVNANTPSKEVSRSYHELAKILHPDKLPGDASSKLIKLNEKIFTLMTEAYQTLKSDENRGKYLHELEVNQSELIIHNEDLFISGKKALLNRRYKESYKIFKEIFESKEKSSDINIYYVWAVIKKGYTKESKEKLHTQCLGLLNEVPTEDRHSANYFYSKGLLLLMSRDRDRAYKCFTQAISLDPKHIPAKRERSRFHTKVKDGIGVKTLLFDLTALDAVTKIFKKIK